jgi:spore maturation protein A
MMKWLLTGLTLLSLIFGILTGRIEAVSRAVLEQCGAAVTLSLTLMGSICFWSGLMEVAEQSKLTNLLAKLLRPVTKFLFRGLQSQAALSAICMSMTANFLGLGNAATPLGLAAMEQLAEETKHSKTASNHMITFVVLNTCSIQLIPTTIITLRLSSGSAAPMEILPAILLTSLISLTISLLAVRCCNHLSSRQKGGHGG